MATKTISVAGGNWSVNETWDEGSKPIAGDAVVAREGGDSGDVIIDEASACASIILTNYVGTLTFNDMLTVTSTVTFVAGMSINGTSDLICTTTATLTSGGKTLTGGLQLKGTSQTYTFADAWIVTGVLTLSGATAITMTGQTISVAGGLTLDTGTSGTTAITLTGGTWSGTGALKNNLTLNGNISLSSQVNYNTGTLTYIAGIITVTGNKLVVAASMTFNTAGMNWNNVQFAGSSPTFTLLSDLNLTGELLLYPSTTITFSGAYNISTGTCKLDETGTLVLSGDLTCTGLFTAGVTTGTTTLNGGTIYANGGLSIGGTTSTINGTTAIVLGGGTWSSTQTTGVLKNNLTFAGNCTVSGSVGYGTRTITYESGIITVNGSTLRITLAATFNTAGMNWNNITFTGTSQTHTLSSALNLTGTLTLSHTTAITFSGNSGINTVTCTITTAGTISLAALLTVSGTMTLPNAAVTFAGTAGWTVATLTFTSIATTRIFTFQQNITYTITTAFTVVHAAAQTVRLTFKSAHATIKAIITLAYGATQNVFFVDPTRIDSSLGQTIFSFKGVITDSFNWSNAIASGNITVTAGGESVVVAGITKDKNGNALGLCDCYLFRDNGNNTTNLIAYVLSDADTGAYSFTVFPGSTYFVVAFKAGAIPVMDVTDRTLVAV